MPQIVNLELPIFQYDDNGSHRIVVKDKKGEWAMYAHPSSLEIGDDLYIGFTEYYSEPLSGNIFKAKKESTQNYEQVEGTRPE